MSQLSGDKRNSYDSLKSQTPGQSSLESSRPAGIESSLLTDNFKELLLDPVDVQLLKLLGPDAEDFLHPTFRDGAKKTLNPMPVQRKCKYCLRDCACVFVRTDRGRDLQCSLHRPELCGTEENECFDPLTLTIFSCKLSPCNFFFWKTKSVMGRNASRLASCGNMLRG